MGARRDIVCWFSHEALEVVFSHSELRLTCPKGPYCCYKHQDDEIIASTEAAEALSDQVEKVAKIKQEGIVSDKVLPDESVPDSNKTEKIEEQSDVPASEANTNTTDAPSSEIADSPKRRR